MLKLISLRGYRSVGNWPLFAAVVIALAFALWQITITRADSPTPNPLPAIHDVDVTAPGAAARIQGDPNNGRALFALNCASCHGARGVGSVDNPGSDDGTVPGLSPIDPEFLDDSQGDAAVFASDVDPFLQHGSRPSGDNPQLLMPAWGDQNLLTQNQIADVESYLMELNGVYWPNKWQPPAEIQMQATRNADIITYQINLVNHGIGDLINLDLKDTLPPGLTYVNSYIGGAGQNPGAWSGSTVEWINEDGVPQGGTLGPFVIIAKVTGSTVPSNVAQLLFTWNNWEGDAFPSSVVSQATTPQ